MRELIFLITSVLFPVAAFGQKPEFDVASVKPSVPGGKSYSNIPLGPGNAYVANGGRFTAMNFPLATYIYFAYEIQGNQAQLLVLPPWVNTTEFDIDARTPGNPTKSEMRLMMRALLADRFKFLMHTEVREVPVLGVVLRKSGTFGPDLRPHPADEPCQSAIASPPATESSGNFVRFPAACNGVMGMAPSTAGRLRSGARNVTMAFLANYLSAEGTFGRPIVDETNLTGTYDFAIEWAPQGTPPPGSNFIPDPTGTTFEQAVGDQLGLKFKSDKRSLEVIVVDRVERPSGN